MSREPVSFFHHSVLNVLLYRTGYSFWFCSQLYEKARAGCFALVVLLMPCSCWYSMAHLHGAVSWSVVSDYCVS